MEFGWSAVDSSDTQSQLSTQVIASDRNYITK